MKKYSILLLFIVASWAAGAQNKLNLSGFGGIKQVYNPALTAFDGTDFRAMYRNQTTSFENAPQTILVTGQARLSDISGIGSGKIQHGVGIAIMHDDFADTKQLGAQLTYSATKQINDKIKASAGIAAVYNSFKTDLSGLIPVDETDPAYRNQKDNIADKFGANIGIAISGDDFYAGYSLNDGLKVANRNEEEIEDLYAMQHAVQAGYRYAFSKHFGLVGNAIYRYDEVQKGLAEGQVKAVFVDKYWLAGGYRQDLGSSIGAGFRLGQLQISYARELHTHKMAGRRRGANEIMLSYHLTPIFKGAKDKLNIW